MCVPLTVSFCKVLRFLGEVSVIFTVTLSAIHTYSLHLTYPITMLLCWISWLSITNNTDTNGYVCGEGDSGNMPGQLVPTWWPVIKSCEIGDECLNHIVSSRATFKQLRSFHSPGNKPFSGLHSIVMKLYLIWNGIHFFFFFSIVRYTKWNWPTHTVSHVFGSPHISV